MSKPILDCPRIVSCIRQRVAAGVPQHVRVYLEVETSALSYALYKPIDSIWREGSAPFRREHER